MWLPGPLHPLPDAPEGEGREEEEPDGSHGCRPFVPPAGPVEGEEPPTDPRVRGATPVEHLEAGDEEVGPGLVPGELLRELVQELSQGDVTVILSTHVLSEVEAICDRVIIIHEGRIVAEDAIDAIAKVGTSIRVRLARPGPEAVTALEGVDGVTAVHAEDAGRYRIDASTDVRATVASSVVGFGLLELGAQRGLEDRFLELTGGST